MQLARQLQCCNAPDGNCLNQLGYKCRNASRRSIKSDWNRKKQIAKALHRLSFEIQKSNTVLKRRETKYSTVNRQLQMEKTLKLFLMGQQSTAQSVRLNINKHNKSEE